MRMTITYILGLTFMLGLVAGPVNGQQRLEGRVYDGPTGVEPPTSTPIAGVTVTLYGSNHINQQGTFVIATTTTNSSGWYGLPVRGAWDYYNIVQTNKAGYVDSTPSPAAKSVGGTVRSSNWIQYNADQLSGTTTGNKFWDKLPGPANRPPVAVDDSYSIAAGGSLHVSAPGVLTNDSDPDGDPISAILFGMPSDGTVTLFPDGSFTYTPNAGFSGTDSYTYKAYDADLYSNEATVTIAVAAEEEMCTINVCKFQDDDGDCFWNAITEQPLANWKIFLDEDNDGVWDPGETWKMTDATGWCTFQVECYSTYYVAEELQPGWERTCPAAPPYPVKVETRHAFLPSEVRFGNRRVPYDYGDAPDGGVAYPSTGVMGAFPTCGTGSVRHSQLAAVGIICYFGPKKDTELDGNGGLCPVCFPPYDQDECFQDGDAGLIKPGPYTINATGSVVPCSGGGTPLGKACETGVWGTNVDIQVTNNLPAHHERYVNVLIDWNQDGRWGGASPCPAGSAPEHVLVNFPVPGGTSGPLSTLAPPNFQIGPKTGYVWARFTISYETVPQGWGGSGTFTNGETEDYLLYVGSDEWDYGDAPDSYGTLKPTGAAHVIHTLRLGPTVDSETDGHPSNDALGDDNADTDDEDGWDSGSQLYATATGAYIRMTVSNVGASSDTGTVAGWIDFDGNGQFNAFTEKIGQHMVTVPAGGQQVVTFNFNVPANAVTGQTFARFRLYWVNPDPMAPVYIVWPTDEAGRGEVEDYRIEIVGEFGDAPEGALAYPSTGVMGNFPTCKDGPAGYVYHKQPGGLQFGLPDGETDGNGGLCGGFPPYDQDESFQDGDAGLTKPEPYTINAAGKVVPCPGGAGMPLGKACGTAVWGTDVDILFETVTLDGYVNVLIDWDQNGQWGGASSCPGGATAPEHVLVNAPVFGGWSGILSGGLQASDKQFQIGPRSGYVWARFTISEQPVPQDWDGSKTFRAGETEDYLLYIAPGEGEGELPHVKWSQPPIEIDPDIESWPVYCGWDEPSVTIQRPRQPRTSQVALDDFHCLGAIPVTRVRWWGSYQGYDALVPPEVQPTSWLITFWANVPGRQGQIRAVHQVEVPEDRVELKSVGSDAFPQKPSDSCFRYQVSLEEDEWFHQADFETVDETFWISIMARYPDGAVPRYEWGWKSRPELWQEAAKTFSMSGSPTTGFTPDTRQYSITSITNSLLCNRQQGYDLCFELRTEDPWVKWDQPFLGLRQWSGYADHTSIASESAYGDVTVQRWVADDWVCEGPDPVIAIAWHGSYLGYYYEACDCREVAEPRRPDYFLLSIQADASPSAPTPGQHAGETVWEYAAYDYDEVQVGYDRDPEGAPREAVFRYSVRVPELMQFRQEAPQTVYWFSVVAVFKDTPAGVPYPWGWTNHRYSFGSPALAVDYRSGARPRWAEIPDRAAPVDMSFTLFTSARALTGSCEPVHPEQIVGVNIGDALPLGSMVLCEPPECPEQCGLVTAGGADIWDSADQFYYAYADMDGLPGGDFTAVVRVLSMGAPGRHEWAKAGIMVRQTLDPGSPHAMVVRSPANGIALQGRDVPGGESWHVPVGDGYGPDDAVWVRLDRVGSTVTGSYAIGGDTVPTAWLASASHELAVPRDRLPWTLGLATTSHEQGVPITAAYWDFCVGPPLGPPVLEP